MSRNIEVPRGKIDAASQRCAHIPVLRQNFVEQPSLDPAVFARTTCYPAGHLVAKNAGWRNVRPVVDAAACTGCLQCYLYCPDGAVFLPLGSGGQASGDQAKFVAEETVEAAALAARVDSVEHLAAAGPTASLALGEAHVASAKTPSASVVIDYDFCKGCGICVKVCKFDALSMVAESEALAAEQAVAAATPAAAADAATATTPATFAVATPVTPESVTPVSAAFAATAPTAPLAPEPACSAASNLSESEVAKR